ncbi:hypothetical protein J6590_097631 [Homalodisca vitripennis]|nr:hypothetical protein J6590_097631 [Homalodisca vitripennis]
MNISTDQRTQAECEHLGQKAGLPLKAFPTQKPRGTNITNLPPCFKRPCHKPFKNCLLRLMKTTTRAINWQEEIKRDLCAFYSVMQLKAYEISNRYKRAIEWTLVQMEYFWSWLEIGFDEKLI